MQGQAHRTCMACRRRPQSFCSNSPDLNPIDWAKFGRKRNSESTI